MTMSMFVFTSSLGEVHLSSTYLAYTAASCLEVVTFQEPPVRICDPLVTLAFHIPNGGFRDLISRDNPVGGRSWLSL